MTGNDQSQNIDVKGDFTVTANQSVVEPTRHQRPSH